MHSSHYSSRIGRRLTGLTFLRVLLISFFLGATLLLDINASRFAELPPLHHRLYMGLIVFTYVLTIIYALWIRLRTPSTMLAYVQIGFDLLITTTLVTFTGGFHSSPFLFTLYLPIIAAAILSTLRASITIATIVTIITIITALIYLGVIPSPEAMDTTLVGGSTRTILLEAGLNISFTYLLAWSAGQLAKQLGQAHTEIAQSKLDIRNLQTLNENILASLNSGLLTVDQSMTIIFFNRAAEQITGHHLNDIFGKKLESLFPELANTLTSETAFNERHELNFTPPGEKTPLFLGFSISPLLDSDRQHTGHIIIFQDLSNYKRLEELAARNEKLAAIGQLSAAIAHEIRNPLASISGSVEMLQSISSLSEDEHALMNIVLNEVERLNKLISEFLDYTRPRPLNLEHTSITELFDETLLLFSHHSNAINVTFNKDDDLPLIPMDKEALKGVLWNLLVNAAQAMDELPEDEQQIHIHIELNDAQISIAVEDNGTGLAPADAQHMFEPFFTTKDTGTGLGLATAFRIMEAHKGEIMLTTPRQLRGACFMLSLPTKPPHN